MNEEDAWCWKRSRWIASRPVDVKQFKSRKTWAIGNAASQDRQTLHTLVACSCSMSDFRPIIHAIHHVLCLRHPSFIPTSIGLVPFVYLCWHMTGGPPARWQLFYSPSWPFSPIPILILICLKRRLTFWWLIVGNMNRLPENGPPPMLSSDNFISSHLLLLTTRWAKGNLFLPMQSSILFKVIDYTCVYNLWS